MAYHDNDTLNDGNGLRYAGEGYRFNGVDVFPSNDVGGGFYVRMQTDEWMEYTIDPNGVEAVQWSVRYRSAMDKDSKLEIAIDGIVQDTIHMPFTDNVWQTALSSISGHSITKGPAVLKIKLLNGEVDLNYLNTERRHYPKINPAGPVMLTENEQIMEPLLQITGRDADGDSLIFSLVGATPFSIDSMGIITTETYFDFEEQSSYAVDVVVSDGDLNDTTSVVFNILDVNEAPTFQSGELNLAENKAVGVVDTLMVFDPEQDPLKFTLEKPSRNFILAASGELILLKPLDFEAKDQFTLNLTVSDGEFTDNIDYVVNVLDVNEPPHTLLMNHTRDSIFEVT